MIVELLFDPLLQLEHLFIVQSHSYSVRYDSRR
jgi:hypothetical protein